jgi:hypothetical protein
MGSDYGGAYDKDRLSLLIKYLGIRLEAIVKDNCKGCVLCNRKGIENYYDICYSTCRRKTLFAFWAL